MYSEEDDDRKYEVVKNHEEQYSIWLAHKELPPGWDKVGFNGGKEECLEYIEQVWTDMRPLSLRQAMDNGDSERASGEPH